MQSKTGSFHLWIFIFKSTKAATSKEECFKINSQAAVNKILTQQQGTKPAQLIGNASSSDELRESRHAGEAEFLKRVRKAAKEERDNRLRWSVLCVYIHVCIHVNVS